MSADSVKLETDYTDSEVFTEEVSIHEDLYLKREDHSYEDEYGCQTLKTDDRHSETPAGTKCFLAGDGVHLSSPKCNISSKDVRSKPISFTPEKHVRIINQKNISAKHHLRDSNSEVIPSRVRRFLTSKYCGRLLQCPNCSAAFKFGFQGKGSQLLFAHVDKHHSKYKSDSIFLIMKRYKAEFNSLSDSN